jgi:hypothetical protein
MKVRWITSALLSLAACAVPAAAQSDDYRRCEQYRESKLRQQMQH